MGDKGLCARSIYKTQKNVLNSEIEHTNKKQNRNENYWTKGILYGLEALIPPGSNVFHLCIALCSATSRLLGLQCWIIVNL